MSTTYLQPLPSRMVRRIKRLVSAMLDLNGSEKAEIKVLPVANNEDTDVMVTAIASWTDHHNLTQKYQVRFQAIINGRVLAPTNTDIMLIRSGFEI